MSTPERRVCHPPGVDGEPGGPAQQLDAVCCDVDDCLELGRADEPNAVHYVLGLSTAQGQSTRANVPAKEADGKTKKRQSD